MKRILTILLSIMFVLTSFTSCENPTAKVPDEEQIKMICELTTVKAYYNNLAKSTKPKTNLFEKEREFWVEFEGFADIGFDMDFVEIKLSDNNVTITLPPATILNSGVVSKSFDDDSVITSSDGLLFKNKISTDDLNDAVNKAKKEMEKEVSSNRYLFELAENRVKDLLENYIAKIGEISGVEYNIVWKITDNAPSNSEAQ